MPYETGIILYTLFHIPYQGVVEMHINIFRIMGSDIQRDAPLLITCHRYHMKVTLWVGCFLPERIFTPNH